MEGGWIKIHRSIEGWEWYGVPEVVAIWVHILVSANMKELKWKGITIPRGSFVTSMSKLSRETGLSVQQVRTCIDRLKSTSEITIKSTNKWTIVTVCKYDDYQLCEQNSQQAVQHAAQQSINKQATTSEEGKNIYNINNTSHARAREDWRFISSVRASSLNNDPGRIAAFKKDLFRAEVEAAAPELGMTAQQVEAFCRWWTENSPGSDKIRAEFEVAFDTRSRMQNWIDRDRPRLMTTQPAKSRLDKYKEDMQFIHDYFNGQEQHTTTADEQ